MIRLTRRYRFSASHRLHSPSLSDQENAELYGKCNNPWGHGHNYILEIAATGTLDRQSGQVVDVGRLDRMVRHEVLDQFDHRDLNHEAPGLNGVVPTSENVAAEISRRLTAAWPAQFDSSGPRLQSVRLFETRRNIFELTNEE